ncbi:MAG: hypothetical protein KJ666_15625 [Bacteroidetes bacterium]|nr:hypothetical protein [Bacteroidota bacterium]MBU2584562.1 hypothetical protein [Bacteroidota bacterium]
MHPQQITSDLFGTKIFQLFPALKTGVDKSLSRPARHVASCEAGGLVGIGFDIPATAGRYDYSAEGGLFNDEATKRIIREGDSIGCFYIESPGMCLFSRALNFLLLEFLLNPKINECIG